MNVKLIRMHSGEDVIADLISEEVEQLIISNPIVLVPGRDGTVGFAPWSPVIAPEVTELRIRASYTVYVTTPNDDVVNNYNQIFSPLTLPKQNTGLIL
jgi:hypothetical protein